MPLFTLLNAVIAASLPVTYHYQSSWRPLSFQLNTINAAIFHHLIVKNIGAFPDNAIVSYLNIAIFKMNTDANAPAFQFFCRCFWLNDAVSWSNSCFFFERTRRFFQLNFVKTGVFWVKHSEWLLLSRWRPTATLFLQSKTAISPCNYRFYQLKAVIAGVFPIECCFVRHISSQKPFFSLKAVFICV